MKPLGFVLMLSVFVIGSAWAIGQQTPATGPTPNAPAQTAFQAGKGGSLENLDVPDPETFTTKDGRKGWKIKIPGGRPLATPAVVGGILYVGGGFGSHEFYALDAATGKRVWTFKTGDDGPTAAVVAEDCVVYNTESCTIYVHDARTGKVLWDKWLGDPLMSQPAIGGGRLFMAYPGKGGHHLVAFELKTGKVQWDQPIDADVITAPVLDGDFVYLSTCVGTVYCFDQASGKLYWKDECSATSAPAIVNKKVYFSQRQVQTIEVTEGQGKDARKVKSEVTVEGFNAADAKTGKLAFSEPQGAIRASYLLNLSAGKDQLAQNASVSSAGQKNLQSLASRSNDMIAAATTQPATGAAQIGAEEVLKRLAAYKDRKVSDKAEDGKAAAEEARKLADDLEKVAARLQDKAGQADAAKNLKTTAAQLRDEAQKVQKAAETSLSIAANLKAADKEVAGEQALDASVAFAAAPASAKLSQASSNLGKGNVKSIWAFQGSRPLPFKDGFVAIQGDQVRAISTSGEKTLWQTTLKSEVDATRPGTPPAMADGKIYFGTSDGRIVCADPATGKILWDSSVGGNIRFQPAVAGGKVYVATDDGSLVCLDAGDAKADGWTMWGGSAQHNGPAK